MSNILYRMQIAPIVEEDNTCVIDSNDLLEECIQKQKKKTERIRKERERKAVEPLYDEDGDLLETEEFDDAGFVGLEEIAEEESVEEQVDYVALAQAEAEQILMDAKEEAERILADAANQAEAMKFQARQDGHKEGHQEGYQEAIQEQMQWEEDNNKLRMDLQNEYEAKERSMERDLVDVICQVVEKVFLVQFGDKKELILHSIDNVLSNVEGGKEFLIRVNEANAEYLRNKKEELQEKVGQEVVLDIVLDPLLDESQCMIETDGGLFDCSMDTQMKNLVKDIRSLSSL